MNTAVMNTAKWSLVSVLVSGLALACAGAACSTAAEPTAEAGGAPVGLRSQRRLTYRLAGQVAIVETPQAGIAVGLDRALRNDVRKDMREVGLEVDGDPAVSHDLTVHLSASVQGVGRLLRARASMWLMNDAQLFEQISSAEVIEAPDRLADALARDLVDRLARSPRTAEYADAIYGRRLRPLRSSVGHHAAGRGDEMAGVPPLEALNYADSRRVYGRTMQGRTEVMPPAPAPDAARAAARTELQKGQGLLTAGQPREAYFAFEQAYLMSGDADPLFGMAESLLKAGAKQQAVIFYRAYLRRAQPNSPEAARANAQVSALEPSTPARQ